MPRDSSPDRLTHAIIELLGSQRRALHAAEIATRLAVSDRNALRDALEKLVDDGVLTPRGGRRYRLAHGARVDSQAHEGIVVAHAKGFGFVKVAGSEDDVFVSPEAMAGAMHGDRVRVQVVARTNRGPEGSISDVLERGRERVVGTLRGRAKHQHLEPDDSRIRGPIEIVDDDARPAGGLPMRAGLAAVVEITRYPEASRENPQGSVVQVLGQPGEPDVEVAKVLVGHGIDETFPDEADAEARAFGDAPDAAELASREDLRDIPLVTIDPHDARDHDDALWVERDDNGNYRAWIAIADVSHYVRPGSSLDACALARGCSVYIPDRSIPMLPRALSSVLCSLLPDVDRLCLCVIADLDPTGKLLTTRIVQGAMRSRAFLSYQSVARALGFSTEPARDPKAESIRHQLRVMWELASELRKRRLRRGALDLDVPEARVVVDDDTRAPVAISQRSDDPGVRKAYRLVEEMMLLANEAVARFAIKRELPVLFRVHGVPDQEKVDRFAMVCAALGVEFDADASDPKQLSKFLRRIEAHPKKAVMHGLLLRAMQQACYDPANIGHFGLASGAYVHFTSPIRRYPDLVVHRAITASLRGEPKAPDDEETREALQTAAITASQQERNAMEAERGVGDVYRAIYMMAHIGESFDGTVTAITGGGVYVRLSEPFVDVLVLFDALGFDAYAPDDLGLSAVGERSGDTVSIGDAMTLRIEDVSLQRRTVLGKRLLAEGLPKRRMNKKERKRARKEAQSGRKGRRKGRGRGRGR